jgi:hypothetical protein
VRGVTLTRLTGYRRSHRGKTTTPNYSLLITHAPDQTGEGLDFSNVGSTSRSEPTAAGEIPVRRETERPAGVFDRRSDFLLGFAKNLDSGPGTCPSQIAVERSERYTVPDRHI